jgi:chromosome partitioning protein
MGYSGKTGFTDNINGSDLSCPASSGPDAHIGQCGVRHNPFSGNYMTVIVVANPKGGVGKSTLSTNLAGYFAANGEWVALADLDRQQSAHGWLGLRPEGLPKIEDWAFDVDAPSKPPKGLEKAVVDTPAGIHGSRLAVALELADKVIVPLQPSLFDILATQEFLVRLQKEKAVRKGTIQVGVVGMRVDARTKSADQLHRFVEGLDLPVLGFLRDTQNYVQAAAHGLTLWDVARSRVEKDIEQWQPIVEWAARK